MKEIIMFEEQLSNFNYINIFSIIFLIFIIMAVCVTGYEIIGKFSVMINRPIKKYKQRDEDHKLILALQTEMVEQKEISDKNDAEIKRDISDMKNLLIEHIETGKKNTQATFRSSLYRMHSDFTSQGFITREGLKTFLECGKAYEDAGGDDIYHDKLKPEIMKLEIKDEDL